jgi:hypothetical protein
VLAGGGEWHPCQYWRVCLTNFQSQAVELHRIGARVAVSVDPTMELKTPGRKEGRGEGESAYYEKKKAQEDRNLTFEQRITEICHTVRASYS